jgi:kumamolisin
MPTQDIARHVPLPDSRREAPREAELVGPADPHEEITVTFLLRREKHDEFQRHLEEAVHRPEAQAPLTSESFESRGFGASQADLENVADFARRHGLEVVERHAASRRVQVRGTVEAFQGLFKTELKTYRRGAHAFRARQGEVQLPAELEGVVQAVFGLDNRPQAKPHFRMRPAEGGAAEPHAQSNSFNPNALAAVYGFPTGVKGEGQTIGIIELGGGFNSHQLAAYFSSLGVSPHPSVSAVSVDGGRNHPDGPSGADGEVDLDIEVIGALAPAVKQKVYFAPNTDMGFLDAISQAVHDPNVSIVSISWGSYEAAWTAQAFTAYNAAFQDAATLGKVVFAAAGDDGSSDGAPDGQAHVDFPASSPYVVGCGGTRLQTSGSSIASEVVWNELPNGGATGGGVSTQFGLPDYQRNAGVPKASNGFSGRGVPDVAADADPQTGYNVSVDGQKAVIGGTSAVAPLYAALFALLNEKLVAAGKPRAGFPLPKLYAGAGQGFRDITSGNNGAFSAKPGWDACTGWGSPNGQALLTLLSAAPPA